MAHLQKDITFFAKTNFRNQERIFGIKTDDRRRHMYLIGKTGMGKTNLLENLAIQDIKNGHGIAFLDPHGDSAEKLIKAIPSHRINDVIYFNPADQDFPIAFNVMESVDPEYRHLIASGLVGVFKKIWADSWGPRLEYILRNAILALLEYPGSTLLGIMRLLVDKSYRERVVEKITDPVVRSFWVDEFTKWNDRVLQEVISPIQNKVGQFTSSALIRNIVGQASSSFDVRKAMDERKILIMNLSKGRLGEDNSALLGAMMITKIQLAAMARVDIAEEERADFYLYVDEFQNFATESFANILSEARKYHLNLILANQYVTQIDEKVRDAIFGNAGSIIAFRIGAVDAEFLEKEFEPVFMANDLVNLPKWQIYLKLMIDGIAGDAFSATTLPPIILENVANEQHIIDISRERYASNRAEVEDKIRRWSGMLTPEERQALLVQGRPPKTEQTTPAAQAEDAIKVSKEFGQSAPPRKISSSPSRHPKGEDPKVVQRKSEQQQEAHVLHPAGVSVFSGKVPEKPREPARQKMTEQVLPVESHAERESDKNQEEPRGVSEILSTEPAPALTLPAKKMYPAVCVTCEQDIEVPFPPDGKRPTFCRDCLRDYQRATAKAKREMEQVQQKSMGSMGISQPASLELRRKPKPHANSDADSEAHRKSGAERVPATRRGVPAAYVPDQAPISLAQTAFIEPKKFKSLRKKPEVNLSELRSLIAGLKKDRPEE